MHRILLVVTLLAAVGLPVQARDYVDARREAVELIREREYEKASQVFQELARGDISEFQQADALEQAVICLIRLERYDEATQLAKQIPLESVSILSQMRVLDAQRNHEQIIEQFGEIDLGKWPDWRQGQGAELRGKAALRAGHGDLALTDLEHAVRYAITLDNYRNDKSLLLNLLGDVYRDHVGDTDKAIECYREAMTLGYISKAINAASAIADILIAQGKPAEAVAVLEEISLEDLRSKHWRNRLLDAREKAKEALEPSQQDGE